MGYVEPGHGYRGKHCWLMCDDNVKEMYSIYRGKGGILLWSNQVEQQRNCARSPDESEKRSRYDKYLDKMTEVKMIEQELKEKRKFSDLQFQSWAHVIQMNHHTSYTTPPKKSGFISQSRRSQPRRFHHLIAPLLSIARLLFPLENRLISVGSVCSSCYSYSNYSNRVELASTSMMKCNLP